jgi:hypothetical protein
MNLTISLKNMLCNIFYIFICVPKQRILISQQAYTPNVANKISVCTLLSHQSLIIKIAHEWSIILIQMTIFRPTLTDQFS